MATASMKIIRRNEMMRKIEEECWNIEHTVWIEEILNLFSAK